MGNRIRGESATPVQILTIPPFCRFTGAIARVILGAFDKGAHQKAPCRSKSTHLTGRPDHPRPAKVRGPDARRSRARKRLAVLESSSVYSRRKSFSFSASA